VLDLLEKFYGARACYTYRKPQTNAETADCTSSYIL